MIFWPIIAVLSLYPGLVFPPLLVFDILVFIGYPALIFLVHQRLKQRRGAIERKDEKILVEIDLARMIL